MHGVDLGRWQLYSHGGQILQVAGPSAELVMTILHCFTTLGVGSAVLQSNNTTLLSVAEMLTPFCGEQ